MSKVVLCDVSEGIATLTLNRPEKLTAISYEMADTLLRLLDEIETDSPVRAIIITGAGDRAFSAGGDIREFGLVCEGDGTRICQPGGSGRRPAAGRA